jgi:hypothetical protein
MEKLYEALSLMQKICDFNVSVDDLKDFTIDITDKQWIVNTVDNARCAIELDRMKQIIKKVENGKTLIQGGVPE